MSKSAIFLRWFIALTAFAVGLFFCKDLKLADDVLDLLPGEAVRGDLEMLQRMGLADRLFITVSVKQGDDVSKKSLQDSTKKLGEILTQSDHFSYVLFRLPEGYEFSLFKGLQPSLPLLIDDEDLSSLAAATSPEGVKVALQKAFALLNSPVGIATKKQVQTDPLGLIPLALQKLKFIRSEFSMKIDEGFFMSEDGKSCLLVAESRDPLTQSDHAAEIDRILDDAYSQALPDGVEARVIGSLPHALANSRAVQEDLRILLPMATVFLVLLFGVALRNIRFLAVVGVPYLAAPPAIALTSLFYDELNGLALAFGIVLLGITVDVATHLYLALTEREGSQREAMKKVAEPLLFAILTTAAVFVVLLFSQVPCHRQMALLALFGVLFATACAYLVIPAIASPSSSKKAIHSARDNRLTGYTLQRPGSVLLVWLILLGAGVMSWPQLHYNGDLRGLDIPDEGVKADEDHFRATWGGGGEQAFIIASADSLDEALDRNYRVYRFLREQEAGNFQTFAPLLPGPDEQARNRRGWEQFWATHRADFEDRFLTAAAAQGFTDKAFTPFFSWLNAEPQPLSPDKFIGGPLQPLFSSMLKIPRQKNEDDQSYMAMTTVAIDDRILPQLIRFSQEEEGVRVLAGKKWRDEVERLLRHDILTLSGISAFIITLMVIYQFRRLRPVAAVLAPVMSSLAAMSLFCFLTDAQLNMMHLIMGLMVIGVSVDYGIFVVCEKLAGQQKVSVRSVSLTAASSLIGFGVLAFAGHPALYALGVTVLIGIGVAWPTALLVSPALLVFGGRGVHQEDLMDNHPAWGKERVDPLRSLQSGKSE